MGQVTRPTKGGNLVAIPRSQGGMLVAISAQAGGKEVVTDISRLSETFRSPATQEDALLLRDVARAIDGLPEDQRKAVVLCLVLGFEAESTDPARTTAATICGVSGRTIRNRLARAATILSRFKEDRS